MPDRRTFLAGGVGLLAGLAGCADTADSTDDGDSADGTASTDDTDRGDAEPSYHLAAAPVEADDGLEPVLSTDEGAVAGFDALMDIILEVSETYETTYESLSPAEAEEFRTLTADVEEYFAGNPPGYYFGHEGRRVSVTLGGG